MLSTLYWSESRKNTTAIIFINFNNKTNVSADFTRNTKQSIALIQSKSELVFIHKTLEIREIERIKYVIFEYIFIRNVIHISIYIITSSCLGPHNDCTFLIINLLKR